jgi:hypothetical protein
MKVRKKKQQHKEEASCFSLLQPRIERGLQSSLQHPQSHTMHSQQRNSLGLEKELEKE